MLAAAARGPDGRAARAGLDYLGADRVAALPRAVARIRASPPATSIARAGAAVLVVGHEPSISALGAFLLGRPSFPPFRTAQCCAIEDGKPTFTARADIDQVQAYFVE